jgi:hypothetical protein
MSRATINANTVWGDARKSGVGPFYLQSDGSHFYENAEHFYESAELVKCGMSNYPTLPEPNHKLVNITIDYNGRLLGSVEVVRASRLNAAEVHRRLKTKNTQVRNSKLEVPTKSNFNQVTFGGGQTGNVNRGSFLQAVLVNTPEKSTHTKRVRADGIRRKADAKFIKVAPNVMVVSEAKFSSLFKRTH